MKKLQHGGYSDEKRFNAHLIGVPLGWHGREGACPEEKKQKISQNLKKI